MMKLADTVEQMNSTDYKDRFIAEYNQLKIRWYGLTNMLVAWDNNKLPFNPTCPRSIYDVQVKAMSDYMAVLEERAIMEGIKLDVSLENN